MGRHSNEIRRESALAGVINNFEEMVNPLKNEKLLRKHQATGAFQYIPLSIPWFNSQLLAVLDYHKQKKELWQVPRLKFIDVGCGIGTKVALANQMGGFDASGIELNLQYVKVARKLCPANKIIKGDAFKHDYSDYDVIYFYRPQMTVDGKSREIELENHLFKSAKKGAIFLANYAMSDHFRPGSKTMREELVAGDADGLRSLWIKK